MSMTTIGVNGKLRTTDHAGQVNTFNLSTDSQLDLVQLHSTDTIAFVGHSGGAAGPYTGVFNLTSHGGSTTILCNSYGVWSGTIHIQNGSLNSLGGSHSHWFNTGDSVISGDSTVHMGTFMGSGGTIAVNAGAKLEWGTPFYDIPVSLNGGTISLSPWGSVCSGGNITFASETRAHSDEMDLKGAFNAASWSLKDDLLQVFNAAGTAVGSVANFHNLTGKPIQVDQTATGIAVIADATPRPGMIVGHVA